MRPLKGLLKLRADALCSAQNDVSIVGGHLLPLVGLRYMDIAY